MPARPLRLFSEPAPAWAGSHNRRELVHQARVAEGLGSPFVARVLEAAARQLDLAPRLAARIDGWSGDFAADAVAMRLNAGLHALARRGSPSRLCDLYLRLGGDFDAAIGEAMMGAEEELLEWLQWPTQTNEVARSSAFMAALLVLAARDPRPMELLEIGASAGLNLNLARYRHVLGGFSCGSPHSPLSVMPEWRGPRPPVADVCIARARGVDLRPVDLGDPAARERMMAFVWADQNDRAARLAAALKVAEAYPPHVEHGAAAQWLPSQLREPQQAGVRRVVVHSMVAQYLSPMHWRGVVDSILQAGSRATADCPLAWISLEWTAARREVQLRLVEWSGNSGEGTTRTLARCHPYGAEIEWKMCADAHSLPNVNHLYALQPNDGLPSSKGNKT